MINALTDPKRLKEERRENEGGFALLVQAVGERLRAKAALRQNTERLHVLQEMDRGILAARSPAVVAQFVLKWVRKLVPCQQARLVVFDFDEGEATVLATVGGDDGAGVPGACLPLDVFGDLTLLWQGEVDLVPDTRTRGPERPFAHSGIVAGPRSTLSVPLIAQDALIGCLHLAAARPAAFDPQVIAISREVADKLTVALRQARLLEQVRAGRQRRKVLARRLLAVQERERRHLAGELHDEIGQALTAVKINLQALQQFPGLSAAASPLEESVDLVGRALQQVRDLSLDLRPFLLDQVGLVSALRWYVGRLAERTGLAAEVAGDPLAPRLSSELETACFRIVQEALTNVVRHARARCIAVELRRGEEGVELVVRDDGIGFDVRAARRRAWGGASLGLLGMEERVRLLRGKLRIASPPGRGTEVRACFPLASSARGPARRRRAGA